MAKKGDPNAPVLLRIRIRPELVGQLSTHAELSNRTLSGEIAHRLEKSLDEEWLTLRARIEKRTAADETAAATELTEVQSLLTRVEEALALALGPLGEAELSADSIIPFKRVG